MPMILCLRMAQVCGGKASWLKNIQDPEGALPITQGTQPK